MFEEPEDAQAASSIAEETEETLNTAESGEETSASEATQTLSSPQQDAKEGAAPDGFVPKANVEGEVKRRLAEELPYLVQDAVQRALQGQSQSAASTAQAPANPIQAQLAPYSDEQLEQIAENSPEWKLHVRTELNRRIEERATNRALETFRKESNHDKMSREQAESFQFVQSHFPGSFVQIGNQGTWNFQDPLTARALSIYNSDPAFKSNGQGLKAAFLQAKGEMALTDNLKLTKQKTQLTAQQRKQDKVQAQAMNAGAQTGPVQQNTNKQKLSKLMEQYKKTGDRGTFAEIVKLRGLMPDFG